MQRSLRAQRKYNPAESGPGTYFSFCDLCVLRGETVSFAFFASFAVKFGSGIWLNADRWWLNAKIRCSCP
jgi:hypothetical protein